MILDAIQLWTTNAGTSASIANFNLTSLNFDDPYILKNLEGLGVDNLQPQYTGLSSLAVNKFYNMKQQERELTLTIGLNPHYYTTNTLGSTLRDLFYKAIHSSDRTGLIQIRFNNAGSTVCAISGFVKSIKAPVFGDSQDIEVVLTCQDAQLKSLTRVVTTGTPMVSPATTTSPAVAAGSITITDSLSTAPHGFLFNLQFTAGGPSFSISQLSNLWGFAITYPFLSGDQLWFSSEIGNSYVYVIRSGVTTYLNDKLTLEPAWPLIFPGTNSFTTSSPSFTFPVSTKPLPSYYTTYWGV